MDQIGQEQEMGLVEWMTAHTEELLRQDISRLRPEEVLTAACDWSAIAFERRVGHFPKKTDLSVVMQASIAATHAYLLSMTRKTGMGLLYTFGYTMPCADAVIGQLVALDVMITDIRYAANSRVAKWREAELRERLGDRYLRMQELGNVKYKCPGSIQLYQPEVGVRMAGGRLQHGQHLAFMCMCPQAEGCHRQNAAQEMAQAFPSLIIVHL
ncbi:MAG TPA: hypothetical protein VFA10_10925 [Ktedonobacteraceae bacterium]|nr:hypothetical protein [Ktedonobacteraceae bacterium]